MSPEANKSRDYLVHYLNSRVSNLHGAINLRENDGTSALALFVVRYVNLVPEFIGAFEQFLQKAGVGGEIERQIMTARDFQNISMEINSAAESLEADLYQAYLAHRLLEEVNDILASQHNCRIIPVDMTRSNLIVHHIIGEPFANQMDSAVHLLTSKLLHAMEEDTALKAKLRTYTGTLGVEPIQRFPCLTESSSIRLMFKSQHSRIRLN